MKLDMPFALLFSKKVKKEHIVDACVCTLEAVVNQ